MNLEERARLQQGFERPQKIQNTIDDLKDMIEEEGITFVQNWFTDTFDKLDELAELGIHCGAARNTVSFIHEKVFSS